VSPACYEEVTRKLATFRPSRHVQMVWRRRQQVREEVTGKLVPVEFELMEQLQHLAPSFWQPTFYGLNLVVAAVLRLLSHVAYEHSHPSDFEARRLRCASSPTPLSPYTRLSGVNHRRPIFLVRCSSRLEWSIPQHVTSASPLHHLLQFPQTHLL